MSTLTDHFFLVNRASLLHKSLVTFALTSVLCVLLFYVYLERTKQGISAEIAELKFERLLRGACKLPTNDGEATTFARAGGVGFCWELKQSR